jgi:hypothetical protein
MKTKEFLISTIIFFISIGCISFVYASSSETYSLSIKDTIIKNGERIIGFELKIDSGNVSSFTRVPIGWSIYIDNDPSSHSKVKGDIAVGACAVDKDFFKDFIVIEKGPDKNEPLKVEMEIITTTDFEKEKSYFLKANNLILNKQVVSHSP